MSSLWENSPFRDNNCFYNYKTLSDFFWRLDSGGVSRPSWGARRAPGRFLVNFTGFPRISYEIHNIL